MPCTCPAGGPTRVLETRRSARDVVRLRKCLACGRSFTTSEKLDDSEAARGAVRGIKS